MVTELYRRTQPGTLMRVIFAGVALADLATLILFCFVHPDPVGLGMSCVMLFVFLTSLLLFHSLTVTVSDQELEIRFGVGLIRKTYPTSLLQSCEIVRNSWLYGWGIHKMRGGWVYNVSGFDAVEITLSDGRKARIGTDEPRELAGVIHKLIQANNGAGRRA
ncbi:MAG: hypothetical protein NTW87_25545 [Planctomycetota bacterium]|nr:hypothetical protein [Planctomycetota bacterium]